jgi:hypothetical protein
LFDAEKPSHHCKSILEEVIENVRQHRKGNEQSALVHRLLHTEHTCRAAQSAVCEWQRTNVAGRERVPMRVMCEKMSAAHMRENTIGQNAPPLSKGATYTYNSK